VNVDLAEAESAKGDENGFSVLMAMLQSAERYAVTA
jgi:hypothetical protein